MQLKIDTHETRLRDGSGNLHWCMLREYMMSLSEGMGAKRESEMPAQELESTGPKCFIRHSAMTRALASREKFLDDCRRN